MLKEWKAEKPGSAMQSNEQIHTMSKWKLRYFDAWDHSPCAGKHNKDRMAEWCLTVLARASVLSIF